MISVVYHFLGGPWTSTHRVQAAHILMRNPPTTCASRLKDVCQKCLCVRCVCIHALCFCLLWNNVCLHHAVSVRRRVCCAVFVCCSVCERGRRECVHIYPRELTHTIAVCAILSLFYGALSHEPAYHRPFLGGVTTTHRCSKAVPESIITSCLSNRQTY